MIDGLQTWGDVKVPVNVYFNFNGNCKEVVEYYAEVFGLGTPEISKFGDMPENPNFVVPDDMKELVMHARLNVHGSTVMFSDSMPNSPVTFGKNIALAVVTGDKEKLKAEFNDLAKDGKVSMPLQETFWSPSYGVLEDKFGVVWQFRYEEGAE
ncbi:MAG: VOC family protein [Melioribacteraceae bacterium]|nr:VOC family protein [Melioribacteraceae bacterium]